MSKQKAHSLRRIVIAGMISNGLEWYDFALYAFTALTISLVMKTLILWKCILNL